MRAKTNSEIETMKKYDAELAVLDRRLDSLDKVIAATGSADAIKYRENVAEKRAKTEESKRYWQRTAGTEDKRAWESRQDCLETVNVCPEGERKKAR
jgi:hypothetical protein